MVYKWKSEVNLQKFLLSQCGHSVGLKSLGLKPTSPPPSALQQNPPDLESIRARAHKLALLQVWSHGAVPPAAAAAAEQHSFLLDCSSQRQHTGSSEQWSPYEGDS